MSVYLHDDPESAVLGLNQAAWPPVPVTWVDLRRDDVKEVRMEKRVRRGRKGGRSGEEYYGCLRDRCHQALLFDDKARKVAVKMRKSVGKCAIRSLSFFLPYGIFARLRNLFVIFLSAKKVKP